MHTIEHEAALPNVEELLKVDGVDVYFIGPSDLSQSIGYPGKPNTSVVSKAIAEVQQKVLVAKKTLGMPATSENVGQLVSAGVQYIYTHLPKLLGAGTTGFLKAARLDPL